MRVNVYAEEITDRVEITYTNVEETNSTFYGVRFYLESSDKMYPPKHPDDDSSAVTLWVKSSKGGFKQGDQKKLVEVLQKAIAVLNSL